MCMLWGEGLTRPSGLASYKDPLKKSGEKKIEYRKVYMYNTFF